MHLFRARSLGPGGGLAVSNAEHREMVDAVARRDPEGAREAFASHVIRAKQRLLAAEQKDNGGSRRRPITPHTFSNEGRQRFMADNKAITAAAIEFIETVSYEDLPAEALRIGKRCMVDTLGVMIAGCSEHSVHILVDDALDQGGKEEALLLSGGNHKAPAAIAARVLGTAGHAHDWDDTQVSHDPAHVYGLLTHPSVPPLSATIAMAQRLGGVDGKRFMLAFQTGFEVECKISEWMSHRHYRRGHHSSGTVGTFGAAAAAAKLLGLKGEKLAHALGIAASLAAGIRANFGTMTKPLHVGRASENGVTAALLAARGFTADPTVLDGQWGFFR